MEEKTMRNLVRYRPHRLSLFDDMDSLFRTFFDEAPSVRSGVPSVDVREEEGGFVLEAELPGLSEKDIDVKVENRLLTISSKKEDEKEEKRDGYLMKERRSSSFSRSFVLPDHVDSEKIEANFKDGLLTLDIPKAEKAKPKTIDVKKA
jgi:HSP20 family protein